MWVNGIEWKIKRVAPEHAILMRSNGVYALGVCDRNTHSICLNNRLEGALLDRVLTHEICHAFIFSYGVEIGRREEEFLCDFISKYGADIILESKKYREAEAPLHPFKTALRITSI